jgi:hypothetical protein
MQTLENYGAHNEDGKFASGNAYWKFKGGDTYLVSGVDRPADAMAFVMATFAVNSIGVKEIPTDVETQAEWEAKLADLSEDYREFIWETVNRIDVKAFFDGKEAPRYYHQAAHCMGKELAQ